MTPPMQFEEKIVTSLLMRRERSAFSLEVRINSRYLILQFTTIILTKPKKEHTAVRVSSQSQEKEETRRHSEP